MTGVAQVSAKGRHPTAQRSALRPAILLGIGLGGFLDGIVLHEVIEWHHMVSDNVSTTSVAGLEDIPLADGISHAVTWIVILILSLAAVRAWQIG